VGQSYAHIVHLFTTKVEQLKCEKRSKSYEKLQITIKFTLQTIWNTQK